MMDMKEKRVFTIILCIAMQVVLLFSGGCKQKKDPARVVFTVEGQEFSDARISVDGKSLGQFTQTIIKSGGELYIDGQLTATLPPDSPQISKEGDTYSGALDSFSLTPGEHTFTLSSPEGKSLQMTAVIYPGYHLVIYSPELETIKWDNEAFKITPGMPVKIKSRK